MVSPNSFIRFPLTLLAMFYHSTRNENLKVDWSEALMQGLCPQGGLFIPTEWPRLPDHLFYPDPQRSLPELAAELLQPYFCPSLSPETLRAICERAFNFPIPVKQLTSELYMLELFHGPTRAFKDVGARFLAELMAHLAASRKKAIHIITATSGDTGGAVAAAFANRKNVRVSILYPKGRISAEQEAQIRLRADNIQAIAVAGSFDDCQRLCKDLLNDPVLNREAVVSSANSMNIGRLLAQVVYYFHALLQLPRRRFEVVVPSGNLGNLAAGLIAKRSGLCTGRFHAALNSNRVFAHFLETGKYAPKASTPTLATAMDVGMPSNLERLQAWYPHAALQASVNSGSIPDADIAAAIRHCKREHRYILDPHSACAYSYWMKNLSPQPTLLVGTAHPSKFSDTIKQVLGEEGLLPDTKENNPERMQPAIEVANKLTELRAVIRRMIPA